VSGWWTHLIVLPIVLPLLAGTLMLLFDGRSRPFKAAINLAATTALAVTTIVLLRIAGSSGSADGALEAYLLGNWPAPFGIVLVLDQLSALMLMLTSTLGLASLVYSLARWHRAGVHFHPLFQFLLMGLNGAFLTGDLFNLFVFFEVTLAASYGLVLHGSGIGRVRAGLHYIAVNLVTSFLFLIGVSLIYGVTGTLNMADLAVRAPMVAAEDRMLLEGGAAVLGIAFLVKAGMWPLSFWLPTAYAAAAPPVSAIFAIMSKVGIYVVLRLWLLLFGPDAGESAHFGGDWLLYGGMMTIAFGMFGVLSAQDAPRIAGFTILVSSGTLLAAVGSNRVDVTAAALFYLVSSTLGISAFFLLIELTARGRPLGADMLALTREAFGDDDESDLQDELEVGMPLPAPMAVLSISFLGCAALLAGLPPLSGFVAKFALLSGLFQPAGPGASPAVSVADWAFVALLILSGLAALIALTRTGIRAFWDPDEREVPRVNVIEMAPIAGLLVLCAALTLQAGPVMRYMEATAQNLHNPVEYVRNVPATLQVQPSSGRGYR
jgi:multicomponent K+:H+ antiporter subunit D